MRRRATFRETECGSLWDIVVMSKWTTTTARIGAVRHHDPKWRLVAIYIKTLSQPNRNDHHNVLHTTTLPITLCSPRSILTEMNGASGSESPPMNPLDAFLDDLPQPAVDVKDSIHGAVTEFNLPTLSSPLLLLQDVGPGYSPLAAWELT
jgi:hypothetical protein